MSNLEFGGVFTENMGSLEAGTLRLTDSSLVFKNTVTGKSTNVSTSDIDSVKWQKLGNKPGLRIGMGDGGVQRFGGFRETDLEKLQAFTQANWSQKVEPTDLMIKGWNYGNASVKGKSIDFSWDDKPVFEIPCTYVSNCIANKNEAVLEFHNNEKSQLVLTEMRFHMPVDPEDPDATDPVEDFKKAVLRFAGLEVETEQPIAQLTEILCTTPRGRYDIKVYPNSIALHGKTYDYKIQVKTINRLFMVPHRDGIHVYFILSLNPPIRQGQTRYSFLVFEFVKDEEDEIELSLTEEELKDSYSALKPVMSGSISDSVSAIFKAICNLKITVPGRFIGSTGTPCIQCSHKQNPGLLYPMEKGFLFIHKPPMYIRFEEISSCHFARSDGGTVTRTIDFEIDLKAGSSLMFNSIEKEENNKLYDYLNKKNIKIRNAQMIRSAGAETDSSDEDIDPYKAKVQAEGRERDLSESESDDEDYDLDRDLKKQAKEKDSSEGSGTEPDDEYDSGSEQDSSGTSESEPDDEDVPKKKKKGGEVKEKKEKTAKKDDGGKKGKRAKKDPTEPKRAMSAYMIWFNASRASLKEEGDSIGDVAKKGGAAWKQMSSGDKKEWEEKAAEDKSRYEAEMKEYKKNGGGASASAASSSKSSKPSKKSAGPSPSKAKSKEYISDSDDSEEEETPKKKEKKPAPKDDSDEEEDEDEDSD